MIQPSTSTQSYQTQVLNNLKATGITQVKQGGKARAIGDTIGSELAKAEVDISTQLDQLNLATATKSNLDTYGQKHGVYRYPAAAASTSSIQFSSASGTFGSINNGNSITIPAGTVVWGGSAANSFQTLSDTVLNSNSSVATASVLAITPGTSSNVGTGVLNQHNFTGYTSANQNTLLVTNTSPVVNGAVSESDDNYRYRIYLELQTSGGGGYSDIRAKLLAVPGIQDIAFYNQGGSYIVYVYSIATQTPPEVLTAVQSVLNSSSCYPIVGTATVPDLVGISLATTITFAPSISPSSTQSIISGAVTAATNYINNLGVGQPLVIDQIANAILNSSSSIISIGQTNNLLPSLYIWRTRADGTLYSRTLLGDYTPQIGERIYLQPVINAVYITTAS